MKHEGDDGQNAISSEEEMDTTPRTSKRRAVKQVVVSSDDESEDILESHRLGNRFIGSPGNEVRCLGTLCYYEQLSYVLLHIEAADNSHDERVFRDTDV